MEPTPPQQLSFSQLSIGLRCILILTLVGSCAGGSNNRVTDSGVSDSQIQELSGEITNLEREVRRLRADVRRRR